jgi:hypothetical protein
MRLGKVYFQDKERMMTSDTDTILGTVAREIEISEDELLKHGLQAFPERQLRQIKTQIFEITGHYGIASAAEMEACYQAGTLAEADSWRDLQRLDHLEFERDRLLRILELVQ